MNDADRLRSKLLLAAALVVSLVLTPVGSAQASEEEGAVLFKQPARKLPL